MKKRTKQKAQKIHFTRRVEERFGFTPTGEEVRQIVKDIQELNTKFICHKTNRVSLHQIFLRGKKMHVIYDKQRKTMVTAMFPPCCICGEREGDYPGGVCYKCDHGLRDDCR